MTRNISSRDIIIIGQQPWDTEIGSNCKDIALEMSKSNRVLYINSPLDRATRIFSRNDPKTQKRLAVIKGKENGLVKISENLWNLYPDCLVESINWINNGLIFDALNKKNNKKFAYSIKRALRQLNFKNYILFNDNEIFKGFYLKEFLEPSCSVYYSRDYMLAVNYWKKHGERLEPRLIAQSDICMANSTYLSDYCKKNNANSFYVGQGCDLSMFENVRGVPEDMKAIKKPIIGYVGALQSIRLDIALIAAIAKARPEWSVVLVGPEDENFKTSVLHRLPNVIFLGMRPPSELPGYINAFNVCINPQLINEVTIGNYPRKIDEYLAMGKPVVATKTRAMDIFEKHVYLAANEKDFIRSVELALEEDSLLLTSQRKEFAGLHTWENCVHEIYKLLETRVKQSGTPKIINIRPERSTSLI